MLLTQSGKKSFLVILKLTAYEDFRTIGRYPKSPHLFE